MTWSSPPSSSSASAVFARSVSSPQEYLLSPCWRSQPRLLEKCWIGLRIRSSLASTNMMANVLRCDRRWSGSRRTDKPSLSQVHLLPDGTIKVFSRNSEDMSKKYPDLVEQVPHVRFHRPDHLLTTLSCFSVHQRGNKVVCPGCRGGCYQQGYREAHAVPRTQPT